MTENELKVIENKLDDVSCKLKGQAKLTEKQIERIDKKLVHIIMTLVRLYKKDINTKDQWIGSGYFGNTVDDYK